MLPDLEDAWSLWLDFNLNPQADPHGVTARLMFGEGYDKDQRKIAKTCNFGVLFGIGAAKMARSLKISKDKAEYYLDILQSGFPSLGLLKAMVLEQAVQNKGDVYTLYGRRGRYPELLSKDKQERAHAERQAFNFIIQGTEADIVKMIQIKVDRVLPRDTLFIIQAHDELLYETHLDRAQELTEILDGTVNSYEWLPGLKVSGSAKVGFDWSLIH
jgi:DNA polymerase-1